MKKQNKFLTSSIAISLVATTVAPTALAASFSDTTGNTHEKAIFALVEAGVISGYPDGSFKPTKTLTRSDVVKLIGKYLVAEGFVVPEDYKSKTRFTDIAKTNVNDELLQYAALIKDNGVFWGTEDKLLAHQNMTREDMAIALVRLMNIGENENFEDYVGKQAFKGDVKDLANAKVAARPYITVLDYFDITNPILDKFNPKSTTTRGQFATFLQRVIELNGASIKTFEATGAQALTVTFNKVIDSSAKITVKKGTSVVGITNVEFAKDNKSVKLILSDRLTAGTYDVSVTGISDTSLSMSTSVKEEKVNSIEFPKNAAVPNTAGNKVRIPYKVVNQYGEDMTAYTQGLVVNTDVTGAGSNVAVKPAEGFIEISKATASSTFKLGDNISITLLDTKTSTSSSKMVKVSELSKVAEVSIKNVYNDLDPSLTLNPDATYEDFHLVLKAIDQYGLEVPFQDIAKDVSVSISDTSIVDVNKSATTPTFSQLIIEGQKQTVLELKQPKTKKAGNATISINSKSTGKTAKYEVVVAEGVKADTILLRNPNLVVADEKTEVPFEVRGIDGKEITNAVTLNNANGLKITTSDPKLKATIEADPSTGKAKLMLTDSSTANTDRQVLISATTATLKSATLLVTVKAKAEASKVVATKDVETNLLVGGSLSLNKDSIIVLDQYDREFLLDDSKLATAETTANAGKYFVLVSAMDDKVTVSANKTITAKNDVTVTGNKKGADTIKLSLQKVDTNGKAQTIESSAYEMNLKVIDKASIIAYEMKRIEQIYDNPARLNVENYATELIIYGITPDGNKLIVPKAEYTVITGHNDLIYNETNGKISVRGMKDIIDKDDQTVLVKVIVNANLKPVTLDQEILITKTEPLANSIKLQSSNGLTVGDQVLKVPATTATVNIASADLRAVLKITDQYGEDISKTAASRIKLTVTNLVNADADNVVPSVIGNGTNNLSFKDVETGDSFYLTYVVDGNILTTQVLVGQ
ncbi:S-layer homology domain-containing protein [Psychrobacillus psychrotolerans]|uniref:S-layer homology domain-containing protein n=1 Tax=Psychrobacillus psychrotolerans TaxID=126156 RepID=UPI003B0182CD